MYVYILHGRFASIKFVRHIVQLSNNEKVYGGTQSRTSKDDTFSRLSTPKHKIPKSGTESTSKRPVRRKSPATKQRGAKAAGKVSFIDRVKQKAKKAAGKPESASNKLTNPGWSYARLFSGQL